MHMRLGTLLACSLAITLSTAAVAQPTRRPIKQAVEALDDASSKARRSNPQCKQAVYDTADQLADRVEALKNGGSAREAGRIKFELSNLISTASWSNCPDGVVDALHRAADKVEEARVAMWSDRRDDRSDDRRDDRDDDDDDRWNVASMAPLQVQVSANFEGERAVRVSVPQLTLNTMRGQTFYLGARFRSFQGNWSEWVTTQQWQVPSDPFVWKNAFTHFFRYSTLAEEDFANGRFVARVSVFDARGRELVFREVSFTARVPNLPPQPAQPPPVQPPPVQPSPVTQRDCGTGPDVGCTLMRDGRYPMDGVTFSGMMRTLQTTNAEMMRAQSVTTLFANNYATAIQFGLILDQFSSDMYRMQVAQQGVRRIVNPQHALGYATKFNSDMFRTQYTQLFASQPATPVPNVPPNVPPNPYRPPPPPPGQPYPNQPPAAARDCGTGAADPGCSMSRNGRWAMDALVWAGVYNSLRVQGNEITRQQMAESMIGGNGLTAMQLGLLMDLFNNEITRLDVAKFCASRVVNPQHAFGLSSKFRNSILAQDFVNVMGQQR
jgi:hypothetical protein